MPLTMFGAGSSVIIALHVPDCVLSVAHAPVANRAAKDKGVKRPTLMGGGVTADNLRRALPTSDGVIDSNSHLRKGIDSDDALHLNADLRRCFMDQARAA